MSMTLLGDFSAHKVMNYPIEKVLAALACTRSLPYLVQSMVEIICCNTHKMEDTTPPYDGLYTKHQT